MLFNSIIFVVFSIGFFAFWPFVKKTNHLRWIALITASFIFYGWWDWRFIFLILLSGLIDFTAALAMQAWPRFRRCFFVTSILGNIGSLAAFKYSEFIAENVESFLSFLGINATLVGHIPDFFLILPIGISFYTFQSMSYTIDVYRKNIEPTRNILHFFAYLSLFPQLVAGPIVRASELLPQLKTYKRLDDEQIWWSARCIILGFFKKMFLADNLAVFVDMAYSQHTETGGMLFWWLIMLAFAFQIYCDFSGYTDIARGLAGFMGYRFPHNFLYPYRAASLREFWGRWHISLSTWFRDYVYIPLGGSRYGKWHAHRNMWITMLLSGLWHGASWTFLIWGAIHAFFLSMERMFHWPKHLAKKKLQWIGIPVVLFQVCLAWAFFRSPDLETALQVVHQMFSWNGGLLPGLGIQFSLFLFMAILVMYIPSRERISRYTRFPENTLTAGEPCLYASMLTMSIFLRGPGEEFIYFNF